MYYKKNYLVLYAKLLMNIVDGFREYIISMTTFQSVTGQHRMFSCSCPLF